MLPDLDTLGLRRCIDPATITRDAVCELALARCNLVRLELPLSDDLKRDILDRVGDQGDRM
jgi:hypothetical protein